MKTFIIIISLMVSGLLSSAQTYETSYSYDDAGNRMSRKTILLFTPKGDKSAPSEEIKDVEDSFGEGKIIISPNPTDGLVFVNFFDIQLSEDLHIDLFGMNGRLLESYKADSNRTELNLKSNPSGTYILKIRSGNKSREFVLIKK